VAATLALTAILFYVFVYTLWLKRRTEQNIVWGGIAGCFPVLIGWAAVTGELSLTPWILFVVVFLWTPAHYWPLSLRYAADYAAASVPMLSVLRPTVAVGLQVILYAWATVVASLVLIPVAPMGVVYVVVALVAGGWFIVETHLLYNKTVAGAPANPMRVFHASNTYLTALFLAVAIDPLVALR
jgi:protoheme IX farnesyltransferase